MRERVHALLWLGGTVVLAACRASSNGGVQPAALVSSAGAVASSDAPALSSPTSVASSPPAASESADAGPRLACGQTSCSLGREVCCLDVNAPGPTHEGRCAAMPANLNDDDALAAACQRPTDNEVLARACTDSADCAADAVCCVTRALPSSDVARCSVKAHECRSVELCRTSCRTPFTHCASTNDEVFPYAYPICLSSRAHPRCSPSLVCGGETPVCFREEGHAPRCGAADANASGYPCTSAADCGEGMKCTGYRDLAPSTSCAFEPGPAEEGVTCLSDKECEGLFGANGLKLHCDRPEGNAPPSVRFCRVRSGH